MARPRLLKARCEPVGVAGSFCGCEFAARGCSRASTSARTGCLDHRPCRRATSRGPRVRPCLGGLVSGSRARCSVLSTLTALPSRRRGGRQLYRGGESEIAACPVSLSRAVWMIRTVVPSGEVLALEPRSGAAGLGGLALRQVEPVRTEGLLHLGGVLPVPAVGLSRAPLGWVA
jgi:hypothetical protein